MIITWDNDVYQHYTTALPLSALDLSNRRDVLMFAHCYATGDYDKLAKASIQHEKLNPIRCKKKFGVFEDIQRQGILRATSVLKTEAGYQILDGASRVAAALVLGYDYILADVYEGGSIDFIDCNYWVPDDVEYDVSRLDIIQQHLFIATVWHNAAEKRYLQIPALIQQQHKVIGTVHLEDFCEPWEDTLELIYQDDRIKPRNFLSQLKHYGKTPKKLHFVYFTVDDPDYRTKSKDGRQISQTIERLKHDVRSYYGSKRRATDNPIHIPDTQQHSWNMDHSLRSFFFQLDLKWLFTWLNEIPFFCINVDKPGISKSFPQRYDFGGDCDIFVLPEHVSRAESIIFSYIHRYTDHPRFDRSEETADEHGVRFRIYTQDGFHYQIHLQHRHGGLPASVIDYAMQHRQGWRLPGDIESAFRLADLTAHPKKIRKRSYHRTFIREHGVQQHLIAGTPAVELWRSLCT